MTTVTWYEGEKEISICIKGHAGYRAKDDIVCSAISILGQTMISYLAVSDCKSDYSIRTGCIWAHAKGDDVKVVLQVIMAGFHLLEDQYPDYVKVVRGCCMQRNP